MDVKQEYIRLINKVMDYIEANIEQHMNHEMLAEIANFSPYHFHRVFSTLIGESPVSFLLRIRLERAAKLLRHCKKMPIGDIAFECGFSSISLFSRTFHKHFEMTANEFRKAKCETLMQKEHYCSKAGELLSKYEQAVSNSIPVSNHTDLKRLIFSDATVSVKRMPELKVVYCRHIGAYNKLDKVYHKLLEWAAMKGLLNFPQTKLVTVYHDDPAITKMDKARQSACITLKEGVKVDSGFNKMTIPAGKYAVGRFEIEAHEYEKAWNTVYLWVLDNNYLLAKNNDYELHYGSAINGKFTLDICIAVE